MFGKLRDSWCVWRRKVDTVLHAVLDDISGIKEDVEDAQSDVETLTGCLTPITTAPTEANTSGLLKFVVLTEEPATYYDGYYYIILESPAES